MILTDVNVLVFAFATIVGADRQIKANLVSDAWLAALASSHGGSVATADQGFARFGVPFFDPIDI